MIKVAILGFGKLGKTIVEKIQNHPDWKAQFQVAYLWNRTHTAFQGADIPAGTVVCEKIEDVLAQIAEIDLVIECAHPSLIHQYGLQILTETDLFVSSPTALSQPGFYEEAIEVLNKSHQSCYIPLGASVGVWDIIRLDQNQQLKSIFIEMKKHPESFRISEKAAQLKLEEAMGLDQEVEIMQDTVAAINQIAPQNTNTMSIYALAAQSLGFSDCKGAIIADRNLDAHIVHCYVETTLGLTLDLVRDNPASHKAVTGSATFTSFLNSLLNHSTGISHNHFVFC